MSMSRLLAHLVTELEASVTECQTDDAGRYVSALVTSPKSDFAWRIGRPTQEQHWHFSVRPLRPAPGGSFRPAGPELHCLTHGEIEHFMLHPYGRQTGLWKGES